MRFLATTALLFSICVAVLLAVSYQLASGYRPTEKTVTPVDVRGPAPGSITTVSPGSGNRGPSGHLAVLPVLLLGCAVLQGGALVLLRANAAPRVQVGLTSLALALWVVAWWLDGLTLSALAALTLVLVLVWQAWTCWHRPTTDRVSVPTGNRSEA